MTAYVEGHEPALASTAYVRVSVRPQEWTPRIDGCDRLVARLEELLSAAVQQLLEQLIRKLLDQPPRLRHAAAL